MALSTTERAARPHVSDEDAMLTKTGPWRGRRVDGTGHWSVAVAAGKERLVDIVRGEELTRLAQVADAVGRAAASSQSTRDNSWISGFPKEFTVELGRRDRLVMTLPVQHGGHRDTLRSIIAERVLGLPRGDG